jgi:hypothetical protein
MALAVARMSSPSSKPSIEVSPTDRPPKINERCEIDLSPGIRSVPVSGRARRDSSGVGIGSS